MPKELMTPALSDEGMEAKMIALAYEQAKKELEAGTASSQIVTHFLRLGSSRNLIEVEKLRLENNLIEEKIVAAQSGVQTLEMIEQVLGALKLYSYSPPGMEEFDGF